MPRMRIFRRVAVYCGSSDDVDARYLDSAREVGRMLGERGLGVVYGGGRVGLMGAMADAALEAGSNVVGVITERLSAMEVGHDGLDELMVVDSMHARKTIMAALADVFIALPGGFGTLEEVFEATTWAQLGYHDKPVGLLNVDDYYTPLVAFLDHATKLGFVRKAQRGLLLSESTPEALLDALARTEMKPLPRRMERM